jgi:hypothetical protein
MARGEYERAREAFRLTIEEDDESRSKGLAEFNLGVVELMLGQPEAGRNWLTKALKIWEDQGKESGIACLLVPTSTQGGLTFQERISPVPLETVKEALAAFVTL